MSPVSATYDQLLQFAQNVATLHRAGDLRDEGFDGGPYPHEHESAEDLQAVVDNLIYFARQLTPARPDDVVAEIVEAPPFVYLSDRWGGEIADTEPKEALDAAERLAPMLWGEMCFVGRANNGVYGVIVEMEFDDKKAPSLAAVEALKAWSPAPEIRACITQGPHIFSGRIAIVAFIPEPLCTEESVQRWGQELYEIAYKEKA